MTITISTEGLAEEMEKIKKLGDTFDKHLLNELDLFGLEWRDDVRATVSVDTGELRRSTVFEGAEKVNNVFITTVSNNLDYAEPYEYGHKQRKGRYVPAIGKRLVSGFVPGRYTFRTARARARNKVPSVIRTAIKKAEAELNDS